MLCLAVARQAAGVGGQKRERCFLVLAVLGQVEVNAADEIPGWVKVFEEVLDRRTRLLQFYGERTRACCRSVGTLNVASLVTVSSCGRMKAPREK